MSNELRNTSISLDDFPLPPPPPSNQRRLPAESRTSILERAQETALSSIISSLNTITAEDLAAISESFDTWASNYKPFASAFYDAQHTSTAIKQIWDNFLNGIFKQYPDVIWKAAKIALEEQWTLYLGQHAKLEERNRTLEGMVRSGNVTPDALKTWIAEVAADRVRMESAVRKKELGIVACAVLKKIEVVADEVREIAVRQTSSVDANDGLDSDDGLETEGWKELRRIEEGES